MAFLKFLRGLTSKLPVTKTDGNIYFTTDDEKLYIDYKAPNSTVKRACVNEVKNSDLATVAKSGNYSDLSGRPTIPTTLPANGGNADTVDGKHASDFAPVHSHPYDNYSKWTLKANSETTGINITSGTSVDIKGSGTVSVSRSGNVINIAGSAHPTSLPASDVHSWAKASSKPSYSWSEIGNKPTTFYSHPSTHPATMITQDSTHRFITDAERTNWNNAYNKVKDVKNYDVSGTEDKVFILSGGVKVYVANGWCGNNSSSKTVFPAGLFTKILGVTSSTWVPNANWQEYETTADIKIQYYDTTSVVVLCYGSRPASYTLIVFGL